MFQSVSKLLLAGLIGSVFIAACSDDDKDEETPQNTGGRRGGAGGAGAGVPAGGSSGTGGAGGSAGQSAGGIAGTAGNGGASGGKSAGGTAGKASGGTNPGGAAGAAGAAGSEGGFAGSFEGGAGGVPGGAGGLGGESGEAGSGGASLTAEELQGQYLVTVVAQCGGCHTAKATPNLALGGNPQFSNGALPAPNLTSDPSGLGSWTDEEIITAIRDGIDKEGRSLNSAMPYYLFHNLFDSEVEAIVAYLRSLPHVDNSAGENNPAAPGVSFLNPTAFPNSSLSGAELVEANRGKHLLTSAARCVGCHSTSTNNVPAPGFAGRAPAANQTIYPPNLTPDATGTQGWTAAEVAAVLLTGRRRGTTNPVCSGMPGYAGLTNADATAIGRYLTSIPAVPNATASLPALPACPTP